MLDRKRSIFPFCLLLLHTLTWTLLISGPRSCSAASLTYADAIKDIVEVFKSDEDATRRILDLLAEEKAKLAKEIKDLEGNEEVTVPEEDPKEPLETVSSLENNNVNLAENSADSALEENLNEEIRIKREDPSSENVKQLKQESDESNIPIDAEGKLENITQRDSQEEKIVDNFENEGEKNNVLEAIEVPRQTIESLETKDLTNEEIFPRAEGMNRGNVIVLSRNEQGFGSDEGINPTEQVSKMPSEYEMAIDNERLTKVLNGEKEINNTRQDNPMNFDNEFPKDVQTMDELTSSSENVRETEVTTEIGELLMPHEGTQNLNMRDITTEANTQSQTDDIYKENFNSEKELSDNEHAEKSSDTTNRTEKIREMNANEKISVNPEMEDLGPQNTTENESKSEKHEINEFITSDMKEQLRNEKPIFTEDSLDPVTEHYIRFNETEEIGSVRNNNSGNEEETLDSILEGIKDLHLLENIKSDVDGDGENNDQLGTEEESKAMIDDRDVNKKIRKEDDEADESKENNDNMKSAEGGNKEINDDRHIKPEEDDKNNNTHTVKISSSALRILLSALKRKNNSGDIDEIEMMINNNSRQNNKMKNDEFVKLETKEGNDSDGDMSSERGGDKNKEKEDKDYKTDRNESNDITSTEKQLSDLKIGNEVSMVVDEDKNDMATSTEKQFPGDSSSQPEETQMPKNESRNEGVTTSTENQSADTNMSNKNSNIQSEEQVLNVEMRNIDDLATTALISPGMDMKNDGNIQPGEIMISDENENMVPAERNVLDTNTVNEDKVISTREQSEMEINHESIDANSGLENTINNINKDENINDEINTDDSNFNSEKIAEDFQNKNEKEVLGDIVNNENSEINMNERLISNEKQRNNSIDGSTIETTNESEMKNDNIMTTSIEKEGVESKSLDELDADEILNLIKNLRELQDSTQIQNKENIERGELEKDILNTIEESNGNEIADEVKKRFLEIPAEEVSPENGDLEIHEEKLKNMDESVTVVDFDNIKAESPENSKEDANITGNIMDAIVSTATESILNHSSTEEPKEEMYVLPNDGKGRIVFVTSLNGLKNTEHSLSTSAKEIQEESFDKAAMTEETSSETPMTTEVNDIVNSTENNEKDSTIIRIPVFEVINSEGQKTNESEEKNQDEPTSEATDENNKPEIKEENGNEEVKGRDNANLKDNIENTSEPAEENKEKLEGKDNTESEKNKEGIH